MSICSECYGFDPYYNDGFEKQGITFEEGVSIVGKVARKGGLKGLGKAAKLAMAGKTFLNGVPYSLHMTFDGLNDVVTNEHQEIAAEICVRHGGTEMVNSIPRYFELSLWWGSNRSSGLGRGAVASGTRFLPAFKGSGSRCHD